MQLGEWLRSEGISQAELARRIDVNESTISRLLKGTRRPSTTLIEDIRRATRNKVTFRDWVERARNAEAEAG